MNGPGLDVDWYDFAVCAVEPGPIRAAGGISVQVPDVALAQIAERAGFGSEESLRHHFRRLAATTPGAYRRRFVDAGGNVESH